MTANKWDQPEEKEREKLLKNGQTNWGKTVNLQRCFWRIVRRSEAAAAAAAGDVLQTPGVLGRNGNSCQGAEAFVAPQDELITTYHDLITSNVKTWPHKMSSIIVLAGPWCLIAVTWNTQSPLCVWHELETGEFLKCWPLILKLVQ